MRHRLVQAFAAAMLCVPPGVAEAQSPAARIRDGAGLEQICANNRGGQTWCLGYISGVLEAFDGGSAVLGIHACVPTTTSDDTVMLIVRSFLQRDRMRLRWNGARVVAEAVAEAYPCPTASR